MGFTHTALEEWWSCHPTLHNVHHNMPALEGYGRSHPEMMLAVADCVGRVRGNRPGRDQGRICRQGPTKLVRRKISPWGLRSRAQWPLSSGVMRTANRCVFSLKEAADSRQGREWWDERGRALWGLGFREWCWGYPFWYGASGHHEAANEAHCITNKAKLQPFVKFNRWWCCEARSRDVAVFPVSWDVIYR